MSETRPGNPDSKWLPDETGIACGAQVDDDQVGESFSVRFRRSDEPGAMITRTAYPVNVGGGSDEPFHVRVETEWLICSDPMDPGGTEVWSDSIKEDESGSFGTAAEAEGAARNTAIELLKDAASLTWDGLPRCERSDT